MSASFAPTASRALQANVVAAVDLGSNSFHMVIARNDLGKLRVLDKMRERVRLAAGLDGEHLVSPSAQRRAIRCLERFGERLHDLSADQVRVVGTNTLRSARNADEFLPKLRRAIGHPIDIISGREEARLIYLGVAHDMVEMSGSRLVVDIGGGSTECIIGEHLDPIRADSLHMGCVTFTRRFFPGGKLRPEYFKHAELAAALELRSIKRTYRKQGWDEAVGASGTITAVDAVLRANQWSNGITLVGLDRLRKAITPFGRSNRIDIPGLEPDRKEVLPGGLAILIAVFRSLKIERMAAASGALREGVLYDLLGRQEDQDVRERTVSSMASRYGVDPGQAERVERTATALLIQVEDAWNLEDDRARRFLSWAARLHEIGLALAYSGFHKHGEYLIENSDMPGFSRGEQQALARLIRTHRRRFKPELFEDLGETQADFVRRLAVLLRLAVSLNRSRSDDDLPPLRLRVEDSIIRLEFPPGWLENHPMTQLELEREAQRYRAFKVRLRYR
ncbi:MAG: exopolyphosphatase [Myxococcota bacterium]